MPVLPPHRSPERMTPNTETCTVVFRSLRVFQVCPPPNMGGSFTRRQAAHISPAADAETLNHIDRVFLTKTPRQRLRYPSVTLTDCHLPCSTLPSLPACFEARISRRL